MESALVKSYKFDFKSKKHNEQKKQTGLFSTLIHFQRNRTRVNDPVTQKVIDYTQLIPSVGIEIRNEEMRLATFVDWPSTSPVNKKDLARCGFHYSGISDRVQCVYCKGVLHSWEKGDNPYREHRRSFPTCPLVLGMNVLNKVYITPPERIAEQFKAKYVPHDTDMCPVPAKQLKYEHQSICTPRYITQTSREKSLAPLNIKSKTQLAGNGFFYDADRKAITCFSCDYTLPENETSDPIIIHPARSPDCAYLLGKRNKPTFVMDSSQTLAEYLTPTGLTPFIFGENEILARMDTWMVRQAIRIGYKYDMIQFLLSERLRSSGEDFHTIHDLLDTLEALKKNMATKTITTIDDWKQYMEDVKKKTSMNIQKRRDEVAKNIKTKMPFDQLLKHPDLSSLVEVNSKSSEPQLERARAELVERLKSNQVCKICMDRQLGVVFRPCGHIVTCGECASSFTECPLCRSKILQMVRVNISDSY